MRINPGVELRETGGHPELTFTKHVDGPTATETRYGDRLELALAHARAVSDADLVCAEPEWVTEQIVERFAAKPVTCYLDDIRPERIPLQAGKSDEHREPRILFRLSVRATGAASAARMNMSPSPEGVLLHADVVVSEAELAGVMNADWLGQAVDAFTKNLARAIEAADKEIEQHRRQMRDAVLSALTLRFRSVKALHEAAASIGIPIGPRTAPERIPLQPRKLTILSVEAAAARGQQQWRLDEAIAEDITTTIMAFSSALERLPLSAAKLLREDEETIRDILLFILNANYQGGVTAETFRGRGKTDLLLRWKDRDAFIGECKFWEGSKRFTEAVTQLLGYTVWRDTRAALVLFLRDVADTGAAIAKAAESITGHPRFVSALALDEDPLRRQDFIMSAAGDSERFLRLSLLPVVITKPHAR
ncbi:hypothetical protein [Catellatospora chokoriensis]|uniref:Uncharacterized protein n=1 Tax=Catellatospora chokoriensis TaxID=310353 RepID=A0A8J3K6S8_9ACTN|nr:hypothetical protein [Catellatospora chokoriensis]GIF93892.1 hypothetical protein Cch02nite_73360 [Catellatospora chokoriensis]